MSVTMTARPALEPIRESFALNCEAKRSCKSIERLLNCAEFLPFLIAAPLEEDSALATYYGCFRCLFCFMARIPLSPFAVCRARKNANRLRNFTERRNGNEKVGKKLAILNKELNFF